MPGWPWTTEPTDKCLVSWPLKEKAHEVMRVVIGGGHFWVASPQLGPAIDLRTCPSGYLPCRSPLRKSARCLSGSKQKETAEHSGAMYFGDLIGEEISFESFCMSGR